MTEDIPRQNGLAELHIHKHSPSLKSTLIGTGCLILVAVAWGGSGKWREQVIYPPTQPAIYVVMTVDHNIPVTETPTPTMTPWPTSTMMPPGRTAAAVITEEALTKTPTPYAYTPGVGGR